MQQTRKFRLAFTIGASILGVLVVIFSSSALLSRAQTTTNTSASVSSSQEAEESVVIDPGDTPLDRLAKLRRLWVVYREIDSPSIYAMTRKQSDGKRHKKEIQTLAFFTKFNANYLIKLVVKGRLDAFPTDDPITSVDNLKPEDFVKHPWKYRLVKAANNKAVHLVTPDGKRRVVIAEGVFHRFGWEFRDVETVSDAELAGMPQEAAVTDATVFSEDVSIQTTENRLVSERVVKRLNLQKKLNVRTRLIKAHNRPDIYVIDAKGMKHKIANLRAAQVHRLNLGATTEVTPEELAAVPEGAAITEAASTVNLNATVSQ